MKRLNLGQIVAQAMDMFNKDYASDTLYWDETNFKANVISYYAKLMNDECEDKKSQNKNEAGFRIVELSSSWLMKERVKVNKEDDGTHWIETKQPYFEFTFDAMSSSVHSIIPVGKCSCEDPDIIRLSNKDIWKHKRLPKTCNIYWYGLLGKFHFPCTTSLPDEMDVVFLPAMTMESDCMIVPEPYVTVIITTILQQMFGAKNEMKIVDTSNDGNPNTSDITEINPDYIKQ